MHAEPRPFAPAVWLRGRHFQTVGARLLRPRRGVRLARNRIATPDGDFLDLDFAETDELTWREAPSNAPFVLLLHGLEGSASSGYALEIYRALARHHVRAVGLNFRSCGGEMNRTRRLYPSGETDDVGFAIDHLARRYPRAPIGAVGVSLGGNVLLKLLGERGGDSTLPVRVAAAISVPYDLAAGADALERGVGPLYAQFFLRKLKRKVRAKAAILDGVCDVPRALAARTLRDFDDAATAPLHGFDGAQDYYRRSSSNQFLARVTVPTLLVHAMDDPFLPSRAIPMDAIRDNPALEGRVLPRGGHVGFVEGAPWAPRFWAEAELARFLSRHLGESTAR